MSSDRRLALSHLLYRLLRYGVVSPIFRLYFRGRVYGRDKMPMQGRVIVVSNHASDFDPPFVGAHMLRPVAFMAKEELFQVPGLGALISALGAYPVKRGTGDRAAIRAALNRIEEGWVTGIFLDGTRRADARIHDPKIGAALIAAKTQAPLLPVSLWGTDQITPTGTKFPRPVPVTIRVGDLIPPPPAGDRAAMEAVTQQCTDAIHALLDLGR